MANSPIILPRARFSYPHLFTAHRFKPEDKPKFSVRLIVSKDDTATVAALKAEIQKAFDTDKQKAFKGNPPSKWESPLHDGDEDYPDNPEYENSVYLNAKTTSRPYVGIKIPGEIDNRREATEDEVYAGAFGKAGLGFGTYNQGRNQGVSVYLNTVLMNEHGPRLSAGATGDGDFGSDDDDLL